MAVTPYAVFVLAGAVAAAVLTVVVFLAAPHRRSNQALAVLLFFEATSQGAVAALALLPARLAVFPITAGLGAVFITSVLVLPIAYLLFLATLGSPLVRPFRDHRVQAGLVVLAAAAALFRLARPEHFGSGSFASGAAAPYVFTVFGAVALFGLVVAASAFRRAPRGTLHRRQAAGYLAAFGSRDGLFILYFVLFGLRESGFVTAVGPIRWLPPLATLLFTLFMAYGILRGRFLGIDVKVRWTIKQSTVAAVFLAVFFAVSEVTAAYFEGHVGTYLGIGAAALLLFAMAPLQQIAERVAHTAVPEVGPAAPMDADERRRVYAGMVRAAFRDGRLDAHERVMLADLRTELGITSEETEAIEVEVARELARGT